MYPIAIKIRINECKDAKAVQLFPFDKTMSIFSPECPFRAFNNFWQTNMHLLVSALKRIISRQLTNSLFCLFTFKEKIHKNLKQNVIILSIFWPGAEVSKIQERKCDA